MRQKHKSTKEFQCCWGALANELHRLTPVTFDNSHHPRAPKDIMNEFPVLYFHSKRASSQHYYFVIGI
jgi:hypothetical protein